MNADYFIFASAFFQSQLVRYLGAQIGSNEISFSLLVPTQSELP
jgi:hypothetical protein